MKLTMNNLFCRGRTAIAGSSLGKATLAGKNIAKALICAAALCATAVSAQTLTSNSTGTHNGFYYSFWKDSGDASFGLQAGGRYTSQWSNSTNNWVGGKGWKPGGAKVVNYTGSFNITSSDNSYLALYGWTRAPLIEYYVIESYGSYNPASCGGGTDYGSFQSDGATYNVRRCLRTQQPSIDGTQTFYQYFSVRNPKKGFGAISGTITVANHFNFWASKGLNLGAHDYMVLATEGYQSRGSSDLTISEGPVTTSSTPNASSRSSTPGVSTSSVTGTNGGGITVRARGTNGTEHIILKVGGANVANWTLTTSLQNYSYTGGATGDIQVQYDNDATGRDAIIDYITVNGETRQAEDMDYNTAVYGNGSCGGGSNSETMHCNGIIGFGYTYDCFSGNCGGNVNTSSTGNVGTSSSSTGNNNCSGYVGITFDDGPNSNTTALINLLKQHNLTPVTWFNQGNNIASNVSLVALERSVGEVHNHSFTHSHMTSWTVAQVYDELNRTNQAIQAAGAPKPTLFRPPYGEVNSTIQQAAQQAGLRVVTWDVDSQDWNGASAAAIANANNQLQNGQIILMHDGSYTNTNNAIAQIASNLRAKGLCPGKIDPSTGRAVAPGTLSNTSSVAATASSRATVASSRATVASSRAASSVGGNSQCQCNWYGTRYPTCQTQTTAWGWENSRSCIGTTICNSQPSNQGGVVCN